jgi:DNA-binding beta-propeller fold protein YncE
MRVYTPGGELMKCWGRAGGDKGEFSTPAGVAADSGGLVYVLEASSWPGVPFKDTWTAGGNRIQKFDPDGNFICQWGGYGFAGAQFNVPVGMAAGKDDIIYVADTYNSRIQKFDKNGDFLGKWGIFGEKEGQLNGPQGVAPDSEGNIYVADTYNNRIQKFAPDGEFIAAYGSKEDMWLPCGVAAGCEGRVFVADTMRHRILVFDTEI